MAWAAYLVPLALRHHDDAARSRTVDGFSHRLRVLARREPVDTKSARLVTPGKPAPVVETPVAPVVDATPAQLRARRAAAARATKRRRTVLALLLLANLAVVVVA